MRTTKKVTRILSVVLGLSLPLGGAVGASASEVTAGNASVSGVGAINATYANWQNGGVLLGVTAPGSAHTITKIYDVNAKTWVTQLYGTWALWKPKEGVYWTHFESYDAKGNLLDTRTYAFGVGLDQSISGTYVGGSGDGVLLGVSGNNPLASYQIKIYDATRGQWINQFYGQWAQWNPPQGGTYWVLFEAYNSSGKLTDSKVVVHSVYDYLQVVNKKHPLPAGYAPGENQIAGAAFRNLASYMQANGFNISTTSYSGYRSYQTQANLYSGYVQQYGQAYADRMSARPGFSEHQTGLAFDIKHRSGALVRNGTEANWIATNAHNFGFIVRYQPGKEHITGYMSEPWHLRYVGSAATATAIYNSGLTLEEYLGVSGGGYN